MRIKLQKIQKSIGYNFKKEDLLKISISKITRQACNESIYQRMEFLGDKILSAVIAKELFNNFPEYTEALLSKHHNFLVSAKTIYNIAYKIGIANLENSYPTEINNFSVREKKNNLADAIEVLIGAIYLDSDLTTVENVIKNVWKELLYDKNSFVDFDPKSKLQELSQKVFKVTPQYTILSKQGEEHNPKFEIKVIVSKHQHKGIGGSKKDAEEDAAKNFLQKYLHILKN